MNVNTKLLKLKTNESKITNEGFVMRHLYENFHSFVPFSYFLYDSRSHSLLIIMPIYYKNRERGERKIGLYVCRR